jgi:hypothetical protein
MFSLVKQIRAFFTFTGKGIFIVKTGFKRGRETDVLLHSKYLRLHVLLYLCLVWSDKVTLLYKCVIPFPISITLRNSMNLHP